MVISKHDRFHFSENFCFFHEKNIFTVDEILCRKKASVAPFSTKMILSDHPTIYSRHMLMGSPCPPIIHALGLSSLSRSLRFLAVFALR